MTSEKSWLSMAMFTGGYTPSFESSPAPVPWGHHLAGTAKLGARGMSSETGANFCGKGGGCQGDL